MPKIVLIVHNVRSCHNVGSMLRTAEGLGIEKVYLTGYTPYPLMEHDPRMPHLSRKIDAQIHKTALDAERFIVWERSDSVQPILERLHTEGFQIIALEQDERAVDLAHFTPAGSIALIVGREVEGIEPEVLARCDAIVEIPMRGRKESLNVSVAAAIALHTLQHAPA